MKKIQLPKKYLLVIVVLAFTFSSCVYWQDFNAYFNLYYNASTIYEKAEKTYFSQQKDLFEFIEPNPTGQLNNDLIKVVEKCSKILQNYPESNLIPDAIMLTGKALYYQTSYVRAKRKFNEMLAEKISIEDSLWAIFWLSKTDMRLGNHNEGMQRYDLLLQNSKLPDKIKEQIYYEYVKFYKYKGDRTNLLISLNSYVQISTDERLLPNAYMLLGDIYFTSSDYIRAIDAYQKIENYTIVTNEMIFKSKIMVVRCYENLNKYKEAYVLLLKMRNNYNFNQYYSEIDYEIANIKLALNETGSALALYIAIDTLYKSSPSAANANYQIAKLYENKYKKLDSSYFYYQKASKMVLAKDFLDTTNIKLNIYTKYFQYKKNIAEINYVLPKKDTFNILAAKCDTTLTNFDKSDTVSHKIFEKYKQSLNKDDIYRKYQNVNKDSLENLLGENYFEISLIFENDLGMIDSAKYYRKIVLYRHQRSRIYPLNMYMLSLSEEKTGNKVLADSLLNIIYNKYPYTELANFVAKKIGKPVYLIEKDSAAIYYEKINFLDSDNKSLIKSYKMLVNKYPQSDYAVKSLLAIGDIFENRILKYDSAYAYYKTAILKNEKLVPNKIKNKVDMYEKFLAKVTSDTVALALGNVQLTKTNENEVQQKDTKVEEIKDDKKFEIQFEMNMFDIRTVIERRKKRTIW